MTSLKRRMASGKYKVLSAECKVASVIVYIGILIMILITWYVSLSTSHSLLDTCPFGTSNATFVSDGIQDLHVRARFYPHTHTHAQNIRQFLFLRLAFSSTGMIELNETCCAWSDTIPKSKFKVHFNSI